MNALVHFKSGVPSPIEGWRLGVLGASSTPTIERAAVNGLIKFERGRASQVITVEPVGDVALDDYQLSLRAFQLKAHAGTFTNQLSGAWRSRLFGNVDALLDPEEWDLADRLPSVASFQTFLRMIIYLVDVRRPGLGVAADGNVVALWANENNRLSIECLPADTVRWVLSHTVAGERESAAGKSNTRRLPAVLEPYGARGWIARKNS